MKGSDSEQVYPWTMRSYTIDTVRLIPNQVVCESDTVHKLVHVPLKFTNPGQKMIWAQTKFGRPRFNIVDVTKCPSLPEYVPPSRQRVHISHVAMVEGQQGILWDVRLGKFNFVRFEIYKIILWDFEIKVFWFCEITIFYSLFFEISIFIYLFCEIEWTYLEIEYGQIYYKTNNFWQNNLFVHT